LYQDKKVNGVWGKAPMDMDNEPRSFGEQSANHRISIYGAKAHGMAAMVFRRLKPTEILRRRQWALKLRETI